MVIFKSILIGAVAAAAVGFAAAAGAQSSDQAPQLVVHYSPESLNTDSGVHQLYRRLVVAAERVCVGPQAGVFPSDAVIACRRKAMADAVAHIHNSRLAELSADYYAKIG